MSNVVKLHQRRTKRSTNTSKSNNTNNTNANNNNESKVKNGDKANTNNNDAADDADDADDDDDADDNNVSTHDDNDADNSDGAAAAAPAVAALSSGGGEVVAEDAAAAAAVGQLDFGVLHPLEFEWTFWYDKRSTTATGGRRKGEMQQYETNLREIGTFGHVEDFWRYYHHIVKPTEMECNANCHFFKKEIKPMWEDDNNANGGKWVVVVGKQDRPALDAIWEGVLLSLIGETMGDSRELCGAVCSVRKKGDKIAVWTRNRNDEQSIMAIGQSFKKVLIVANAGHLKITYQFHEDALRSTTSYQNPVHFKL